MIFRPGTGPYRLSARLPVTSLQSINQRRHREIVVLQTNAQRRMSGALTDRLTGETVMNPLTLFILTAFVFASLDVWATMRPDTAALQQHVKGTAAERFPE